MNRYFCFVGIAVILLHQSKGEEADCTNSLDGKINSDDYCKKSLDSKHIRSEAKANLESNVQCQHEGLFPDVSDPSCMRYFQCEIINDGAFIKKSFECTNSRFCGLTQKCSSVYACPCDGRTNDEIAPLSESYKRIGKSPEHPCSVSSANNFECSSVGRFPDFDDLTCQTYFLCSHLYNGSYIKTKYKCQNSFFNPTIKRCSANFTCPCTVTTMTGPVTVTLPASQYLTSTVDYTLTRASSIPTVATSEILSTQHGCTIITSKEYECVNVGRFPDFGDVTCRKYFLCSKLHNGTFIKTSYECQQSSFNPLTLRCSTSYICPCTESHTTSKTTPVVSELTSLGSFTTLPDIGLTSEIIMPQSTISSSLSTKEEDKTTVNYTITATSNNPITTEANGSTVTSSTPISVTPITNTSITSSLPSSTEMPICTVSPDDFVCSSVGRFPDLSDFTCQAYYLCSYLRNGSFVKTKYRCPNSARFNPPSQKCSAKYICPCTTAATTSYTVFFTDSTTNVFNLSTVQNATITVSSESTTPLIDTTTSSNSNYSCVASYNIFQCTVSGRFPDFSDVTCRKYFLCSKLQNGTFIKTSYTCLNSTFNPLLYRCSGDYICPCDAASTPVDMSSTSEGFIKLPITPVVTTATSIVTTSSYTCVSPSGDTPEFFCSSIGRFPDYTDVSCRNYFLCSQLRNGTFVKTSYTCPQSSCINTNQRCSSTCKCPCLL